MSSGTVEIIIVQSEGVAKLRALGRWWFISNVCSLCLLAFPSETGTKQVFTLGLPQGCVLAPCCSFLFFNFFLYIKPHCVPGMFPLYSTLYRGIKRATRKARLTGSYQQAAKISLAGDRV